MSSLSSLQPYIFFVLLHSHPWWSFPIYIILRVMFRVITVKARVRDWIDLLLRGVEGVCTECHCYHNSSASVLAVIPLKQFLLYYQNLSYPEAEVLWTAKTTFKLRNLHSSTRSPKLKLWISLLFLFYLPSVRAQMDKKTRDVSKQANSSTVIN